MEAFDLLLTSQTASEDHFKGHCPVEADLAGFINDSHAAMGDFFQQFVIPEVTRICEFLVPSLRLGVIWPHSKGFAQHTFWAKSAACEGSHLTAALFAL